MSDLTPEHPSNFIGCDPAQKATRRGQSGRGEEIDLQLTRLFKGVKTMKLSVHHEIHGEWLE
jgi:hypothetical protein